MFSDFSLFNSLSFMQVPGECVGEHEHQHGAGRGHEAAGGVPRPGQHRPAHTPQGARGRGQEVSATTEG